MLKQVLKRAVPERVIEQYRIIRHRILDKADFQRYSSDLSFLSELRYDEISFRIGTAIVLGASLEHCIRIIKQHTRIAGKNILIIGCGKGDEIHRWVREEPSKVLAIDYLDYHQYWESIRYPNVEVFQADIRDCEIGEEVDLVVSKAVLEHIDGLEASFPNLIKPLRAGGYFWADLGPLYYTWGGAHAPLDYDHLTLSEDEYASKLSVTDYEEGKLFWQHQLFSKLTYEQYMSCFDKYLDRRYVGLEISDEALKYRETNRADFNRLLLKYKESDLLLKSIFYLGYKK